MAKIAFSKLNLSKIANKETVIIEFNNQPIEVTQYLPISDKLDLISEIINWSIDENNYINYSRIEIFYLINIILSYTNLTISEKQKENFLKLYDQFVASGFAKMVLETIPKEEIDFIYNNTIKTIKGIYKHKTSALGILETISEDYSNLNLDASEIQAQIADPDNMALLKNVLSKLG